MIKPEFLKPEAKFYNGKESFMLGGGRTVLDFWRWAYSDVFQNVTRGYVAQFIIAWLVGADRLEPNNPFRPFDVQIPGGKRIEVKSTAWLQSWKVKKPNPMFVIKPSHTWDEVKGYGKEKTLNADIYALCYYYWKEERTANLFDLSQWKFWAFSQKELVKLMGDSKSLSIGKLERSGSKPVDARKLCDALLSM